MNRWIAGMGALIVLWAGVAWALTSGPRAVSWTLRVLESERNPNHPIAGGS